MARSDRTAAEFRAMANANDFDFWLNLGKRDSELHSQEIPIINSLATVGALMYPESVRFNLNELAVPRPDEFPADVWIKPPGWKGRGKTRLLITKPLVLPDDWDWQLHIKGTEYRVVTVGRRAVQAFRREGTNDDRDYGWTGLENTPDEVLSTARKAARYFENNEYPQPHNIMYAWDLIQDEETNEVYLFEGNTCPGVSHPTAERIVNEITRQIQEGRIVT